MSDETGRKRWTVTQVLGDLFIQHEDGMWVRHPGADAPHEITEADVDACPFCQRSDYEWDDQEDTP